MSATTAKSIDVLTEDFQARPTVWVIDGLHIWPAFVTKHPDSEWGMMEVVYHHHLAEGNNSPFGPVKTVVSERNVKSDKQEAECVLLKECCDTIRRLTTSLTDARL